jgi:uncharacterized protein (TIGR03067 family)
MPSDTDALQGEWYITAFELDGQAMPEATFAEAKVVVADDRFKSLGMGAKYEGTFALDPSKKPKAFDLHITTGHAAGTRNLGIYRLGKDGWTLCLATRGGRRPRAFTTKPDSGLALQTFARLAAGRAGGRTKASSRRVRLAKAAAPVAEETHAPGPPTEIEGEWQMVGAVFNGREMPESMMEWCRRTTRGDVTKIVAGTNLMLEARFTLDRTTDPWRIDYINTAGSNKGKAQAGIVQLNGDTLQICMAAPGDARPEDFTSVADDKRSYTVWRLVSS